MVLLKKKGMNDLITEMPLHSIESVDVDGEGAVTLTGRSYSQWARHGDPPAFKMRDVQDGYAGISPTGCVKSRPRRPRRSRPHGLPHRLPNRLVPPPPSRGPLRSATPE